MKILMLISDLSAAGSGMQFARLAAGFKGRGCEVEVISLKASGELGAWLEGRGIRVDCLGMNGILSLPRLVRLPVMIMKSAPNILQTWGFHANIAGKFIGFFCGARLIVSTIRGPETPFRIELERITSFFSFNIVVSSSWIATNMKTLAFASKKFDVIGNCMDASFAEFKARRRPAADGRWRILFLGRRSFQSGIPSLVGALSLLKNSGYPVEAEFVGEGSARFDAELMAKAAEAGVQEILTMRPPVPHSEVPALMEGFHLLVAPNVFNWTPNTILEAFASGLPVVAADIEGVKEIVSDGSTGFLAKPNDPASLYSRMSKAFEDYSFAVRMSKAAAKALDESLSVSKSCRKYFEIYKELAPDA